jgi:hypothetical protein
MRAFSVRIGERKRLYGRCWDRADNPGEAIARGIVREGRSVYRGDRDFDHDRGLHRGWDRDRGLWLSPPLG